VRADRVAELKKAIQSGTYKVDARKIADKMVDSSLEEAILLGRKNS
jgi:flagellar biosynthesis anti-sigma factor FlgM